MAETKTTRNARLKAMRKKFGLGEFKNKIKTTSRRVVSMARGRKKSYSKSSGMNSMKMALAGVGASSLSNKMGLNPLLGYGLAYMAGGGYGIAGAFVVNSNLLSGLMSTATSGTTQTSGSNIAFYG